MLTDWQFGVELPDSAFAASVSADYEGIPVIQRASAVQEQIEKAKEGAAAQPKEKP